MKYLAMKIIFCKSDGRLFGAQAVGEDGVDKRIDAFAMALQLGGTIYDLEEAELCYAPQFGSAKSSVDFAGVVAADVLRGDMPLAHWNARDSEFLLAVRHPEELAIEQAPGAVNISLDELRDKIVDMIKASDQPVTAVLLDSTVQYALDITSSNMLKSLVKRLHNQGIETYFAEVQDPVLDFSAKTGLLELVGEDHLFSTVDAAVRFIEASAQSEKAAQGG